MTPAVPTATSRCSRRHRGWRAAVRCLRSTLALRLWLALETIPEGWPVGALVALLEVHVARLEQDTGGEAGW